MTASSGPATVETHVVRMGTSVAEAASLSDILLRCPADVVERVHDQLWLRTVLIEQRRRTALAERAAFDARADRLLELLDPPEEAGP